MKPPIEIGGSVAEIESRGILRHHLQRLRPRWWRSHRSPESRGPEFPDPNPGPGTRDSGPRTLTASGRLHDGVLLERGARMSNRIGIVPFWKNYDRKAVIRYAQVAEELGYDSIWVPEAWAYEQFQLLAEIAVHTKRLGLATGIANVFSRSPGLLAMSAATLD